MLSQRNTIIWAVIAIGLFTLLIGARSLISSVANAGPDVQSAYDELAQALDRARLLPLGMDDEWLMAMAPLARDPATVSPRSDPATTGDILALGSVIEARSKDRQVHYLKLRPSYYNEIVPGTLAQALLKLSRFSAKAQLAAGSPGPAINQAVFPVSVDGEDYDCRAQFKGSKLDEVVITAR